VPGALPGLAYSSEETVGASVPQESVVQRSWEEGERVEGVPDVQAHFVARLLWLASFGLAAGGRPWRNGKCGVGRWRVGVVSSVLS
jgi:hypothetical protein